MRRRSGEGSAQTGKGACQSGRQEASSAVRWTTITSTGDNLLVQQLHPQPLMNGHRLRRLRDLKMRGRARPSYRAVGRLLRKESQVE